jgi:hypothetical protein
MRVGHWPGEDAHLPSDQTPGARYAGSSVQYAALLDCLGRVFSVDDLTDGTTLSTQLTNAVSAYVTARRDEGAHAHHVVAEVKSMRTALAARVRMNQRATRVADQLTTTLVTWSIAAYFEE